MKLIAFVLPQFHRIPENDAWWGEGFTEWTNTRRARPLYPHHRQPREPFRGRYYDLTQPEARQWQADLAQAYGIYGFCYYHYWFGGKRLLETPFNEVLRLKEPRLPFCLSWANEPWTRRWDGGEQDVLMPQTYGGEDEWELHFYDVLPAFLDERYIRADGRPLFVLYRPGQIPRCEEMLACWNRLAKANGLDGIYFVRTLGGFPLPQQSGFDASLEFEPHYTFAHDASPHIWSRKRIEGHEHLVMDYDQVWQRILNRTPKRQGEPIFPGAFVNWDNTPRLGARGQSCVGSTPSKLSWYLSKQIERADSLYRSEFLFINAWNEWAEGTYLEPDRHHGYAYLEAVRAALRRQSSRRRSNTLDAEIHRTSRCINK